MVPSRQLEQAADLLFSAARIVVLTGAGISKDSGVPTFRDAQTGLWAKYNPEDLATLSAFQRDPERVWAWYVHRLELVSKALPNSGHAALAELETTTNNTAAVITQNVDSLHERAGSNNVIHLHGRLGQFRCSENCRGPRTMVNLSPGDLDRNRVPLCPHCGAMIRPDVVWFGERLDDHRLASAFGLAEKCDAMLVIGTSGLVQPASQLPLQALRSGATVVVINPEQTEHAAIAELHLSASASEVLPALVKALNIRLGRG